MNIVEELNKLKELLINEKEKAISEALKNRYPGIIYDVHQGLATIETSYSSLFYSGDPVGILNNDGTASYLGNVIDSSDNFIIVQITSEQKIKRGRITLLDYELLITYDLQISLISRLLGQDSQMPILIKNKAAIDLVFSNLKLDSLKLGNPKNIKDLDQSQQEAVKAALGLRDNEVLLMTGPPGTGKTKVIARIAEELMDKGEKILITSHTNRAVDNAIGKLPINKALRVGRPEKVLEEVRPYLLGKKIRDKLGQDFQTNENEINKKLQLIRNMYKDMKRNPVHQNKIRKDIKVLKRELVELLRKRYEIIQKAANEAIYNTPVIGSTLVKSQLGILLGKTFDTIIIDEASQASITLALLAMVKGKRWIIVGDDRQLLPIFKTLSVNESEKFGIFTRLLDKYNDRNLWLQTHYRSNPDIIGFSADTAYEGKITTASICSTKILKECKSHKGDVLDPSKPIVFVHVEGFSVNQGKSKYNEEEVNVVTELVKELLKCGVKEEDIGVIAPYRAQRDKIAEKVKNIEIGTVDQFQGREKQVIIFSITATDDGLLFASFPNRLNVAVTRAISKLIVVGNGKAIYAQRDLLESRNWKFKACNLYNLLGYCYKKKAIYDWKNRKWMVS